MRTYDMYVIGCIKLRYIYICVCVCVSWAGCIYACFMDIMFIVNIYAATVYKSVAYMLMLGEQKATEYFRHRKTPSPYDKGRAYMHMTDITILG